MIDIETAKQMCHDSEYVAGRLAYEMIANKVLVDKYYQCSLFVFLYDDLLGKFKNKYEEYCILNKNQVFDKQKWHASSEYDAYDIQRLLVKFSDNGHEFYMYDMDTHDVRRLTTEERDNFSNYYTLLLNVCDEELIPVDKALGFDNGWL